MYGCSKCMENFLCEGPERPRGWEGDGGPQRGSPCDLVTLAGGPKLLPSLPRPDVCGEAAGLQLRA